MHYTHKTGASAETNGAEDWPRSESCLPGSLHYVERDNPDLARMFAAGFAAIALGLALVGFSTDCTSITEYILFGLASGTATLTALLALLRSAND